MSGIFASQFEQLERRLFMAADPVLHWNEILLNAVRTDKTPPPLAARNMAMVHIAIFDAVNAIERNYESYLPSLKAKGNTSVDAAVAVAAHDVLVSVFPAQAAGFDAKLTASLAVIPDGSPENKGVELGHAAAAAVIQARSSDGASAVVPYVAGTDPGDWRPTPPAFRPDPLLPQWPYVTCFAMNSAYQFRPAGPPPLSSTDYATAFNEVKSLGRNSSTTRTAAQTQIALFWADGAGTATPPGHWNEIAHDVAAAQGNSLAQNARLFALLNIAMADAGISAWDCKYAFDFWRPVTAIRAAATDGNDATTADTTWTPLIATPPFPSYTSGHSTFSSAGAAILADFYGNDAIAFSTSDDDLPGVVRSFSSFSSAAAEAGMSRIYGGIHWQFDNTDALQAGTSLGHYVFENYLTPPDHPRGSKHEFISAPTATVLSLNRENAVAVSQLVSALPDQSVRDFDELFG